MAHGVAVTELFDVQLERPWWNPYAEVKPSTRCRTRSAFAEPEYSEIRAQLQRDYDSFVAAVAEADAEGAIDYLRGGYFTVTSAEVSKVESDVLAFLSPVVISHLVPLKAGRGGVSGRKPLVVRARRLGAPEPPVFDPRVQRFRDPATGRFVAAPGAEAMAGRRLGHTFTKHGAENTAQLLKEAAASGRPVGQWLDNTKAEQFIAEHLGPLCANIA